MLKTSTTMNTTMTWGAAPFVALSLLAWLAPEAHIVKVHSGFLAYSVMIFCFMTGTIWGGRILGTTDSKDEPKPLVIAISAFLFCLLAASLAAFTELLTGMLMMMVAYLALPGLERASELEFPRSYFELRGKINKTVVLSHLVIVVHMVQPHVA